MGAQYELYLDDPLGNRLAVLDRYQRLEWARVLKGVGQVTLTFASEQVDWRLFAPDRRLEVWRVLDTGISKLVQVYFLCTPERATDAGGKATVVWGGPDRNDLLARRIIAYDTGSAGADKVDLADDLMKAYVYENLGAGAAAGRNMTAYGFTIAADLGLGPSLSCEYGRKNLLAALQEIAEASATAGTRLYFEIVSPTPSTLEFRTYTTLRGMDRTMRASPLSLWRGTLRDAKTRIDWQGTANHLYVGGQGVEEDRETVEVVDAIGVGASAWNRREMLVDAQSAEDTAAITAAGQGKLRELRAIKRFEGTLEDRPGSQFQLDWDFGDLVTAEYEEELFTCEVSTVHAVVEGATEIVDAKLTNVE